MAEIGTEATLPLYERSGVASAAIFGDLAGIADRRTLQILERRRTSNPHRRGWLVRRLLVLADVVGLVLAFAAVELVFGAGGGASNRATSLQESLLLLATLPGWIVIAKLYGLYDQDEERTHHPTTDDFSGVFHLVTVGVWLFFAGTWVLGRRRIRTCSKLVAFWAARDRRRDRSRERAPGAICRHSRLYLQNTIIVGAGDVGQLVARKLLQHPEYGINLVGFVDSQPEAERATSSSTSRCSAPSERLPEIVRLLGVERDRDRVLERLTGGDARRSCARSRSVERPDRHRPAPVRGRRPERPGRTPSRACRSSGCLRARLSPVVTARSSASMDVVGALRPARADRAAVRLRRLADQARLAGARVLPADAARPEPARVHAR